MSASKERPPGKTTGKKYESVKALMGGEGISAEIQEKVEKFANETRLSLHLAKLRQRAGFTQEQMAAALGVTQPAISKLEAGKDEHITVHHVQEYSRVTKERISLSFGRPFSDMEAVTICANVLKERLEKLGETASQNEMLQDGIKDFLGQFFQKLFNTVALCNSRLPINCDDVIEEMRIEIVTGKKVMPTGIDSVLVKSQAALAA
jgi:transcriptional regulator with XRE-family HTH domain